MLTGGGSSVLTAAIEEGATVSSNAWAVARLVAVLAAIAAAFWIAGLGALLLFIVALVLMVVFHELGHFVTAKWSGMKVTEYFIGFGPRLWSIRRGETDYGVKPILAGAYVKIPGMTNLEQVDPSDEPRTYRQKPFRNRVLVASAGSIMHYVMAFVLAWVAVVSFGVPSRTQVQVAGFVKWPGHSQTAAQAAGFQPGERILSVDGTSIATPTALSSAIQATHGRPATVVVTQRGRQRTLVVRPQAGHTVTAGSTSVREVLGPSPSGKTDWLIGIVTQGSPLFTAEGPVRAVGTAAISVATVTRATVVGIAHVFSPGGVGALFDQVTNPQAAARASANPAKSQRVGSIVQAGQLAVDAEHHGVYYFLSVLIALSIVLGLMNMLPMLPLDGGHVVIALYERVRTRRGRPYYQADVAKLLPVAYAFMAVLVVVIGSAVFLDIAHPVSNPFG